MRNMICFQGTVRISCTTDVLAQAQRQGHLLSAHTSGLRRHNRTPAKQTVTRRLLLRAQP